MDGGGAAAADDDDDDHIIHGEFNGNVSKVQRDSIKLGQYEEGKGKRVKERARRRR